MNDYFLVRFNMTPCMESETDILAALLGEKNFESCLLHFSSCIFFV